MLGLLLSARAGYAQQPELVIQSGHREFIQAIAVSPDGSMLASAEHWTGPVKLWDLRTGKELRTLRFGWDASGLTFSADGRSLIAATTLNAVNIVDTESGREIREFTAPEFQGGHIINLRAPVAASPQGLIASGAPMIRQSAAPEHVIRLHRLSGAEVVTLRRGSGEGGMSGQLSAVSFSPDGTLLAAGLENGQVEVWDAVRGTLVWGAPASRTRDPVHDLVFSPDGAHLLVARTSAVQVWDARTGLPGRALPHGSDTIQYIAFWSETRFVTAGANAEVRIWDWPAGALVRSFRAQGSLNAAHLVPRSHLIALALGSTLSLWSLETGERVRDLDPASPQLSGIFPLRSGPSFLIASGGQLGRWNPMVSSIGTRVNGVPGMPSEVDMSQDGNTVLVYSVTERPAQGYLTLISAHRDTVLWSVPVTEGWAESPRLSPDGRIAALLFSRRDVTLFDARTGRILETKRVSSHRFVGEAPPAGAVDLPDVVFDLAFLAVGADTLLLTVGRYPDVGRGGLLGHRIDIWRRGVPTPQQLLTVAELGPVVILKGSPLGRFIAWSYPEGERVQTYDVVHGRAGPLLPGNAFALAFSPVTHTLAVGSFTGELTVWNLETGQALARRSTGQPVLGQLAFNPDGSLLVGATRGGSAHLWRGADAKPVATLFFRGMAGLVVTARNYYAGARNAMDAVAFRLGRRAYPFEQFDILLNRPDLVLQDLGSTDTARITAYSRAHQRRRQRMGLAAEPKPAGYRVPEVRLDTAGLPLATTERSITLHVQARDSVGMLDRLHVFVNDVPVLGTRGLSLREHGAGEWEGSIPVTLSAGRNRIQVSVQNTDGVESLRETAEVAYSGQTKKPDLYVVAIGVSDYTDSRYDLRFAAKDARDISQLFASERGRYANVYVDTLLDGRVTRENILALRARLMRTQVDDEVVLFLAGHGVLDQEMAYYFAPADFRFDQPALRGIPYEELEGLLDGIPARKKLLLIDTCHAGELDTDQIIRRPARDQPDARVTVRTFPEARGFELEGEDPISRLIEELFTELRRGSGATVIAAAGGAEFALESGRWRNGVFTFAIREGIESRAADADRDGVVRVSELRTFVTERVLTLTEGHQRPVARRENLIADYPLFINPVRS